MTTPMPTPQRSNSQAHLDTILPPEMAERAELVGVKKANLPMAMLFILAVLAGAFISLGAIFATTVATASAELPFGVTRLLAGLAFCLGLILVVVAGAELFTGNNLKVMALASGKITLAQLLRSWLVVYIGNLVGAVATAGIMLAARQHTSADGAVGLQMLNIAAAKCDLMFMQAIALGILCNALVCLAVWLCYSARSTVDKIAAILFPITAFVAAGFEHCVANMYFIPMGLFLKATAAPVFWERIGKTPQDFSVVTWSNFVFVNLLPVTLGNIFGGSVMVGLVYWFVYLRDDSWSK